MRRVTAVCFIMSFTVPLYGGALRGRAAAEPSADRRWGSAGSFFIVSDSSVSLLWQQHEAKGSFCADLDYDERHLCYDNQIMCVCECALGDDRNSTVIEQVWELGKSSIRVQTYCGDTPFTETLYSLMLKTKVFVWYLIWFVSPRFSRNKNNS